MVQPLTPPVETVLGMHVYFTGPRMGPSTDLQNLQRFSHLCKVIPERAPDIFFRQSLLKFPSGRLKNRIRVNQIGRGKEATVLLIHAPTHFGTKSVEARLDVSGLRIGRMDGRRDR